MNSAREAYDELRGYRDEDDAYSAGNIVNLSDPRYQDAFMDEIVGLNLYNKDDNFDINDFL